MAGKKKTDKELAPKKEPVLDIHLELAAADSRFGSFYKELTDEQKKAFVPFVLMRWMSAVDSDYRRGVTASKETKVDYLLNVNEIVNIGFWDLGKHPELQWRLIALAGNGDIQYHPWIASKKKTSTNKLDNLLLDLYPSLNDLELELAKSKLTNESIKQLCKDLGMPDAESKPIIADFKKLQSA